MSLSKRKNRLDNFNSGLDYFRPRRGLEGPFFYSNGRVLYYDRKEGRYWDPKTDFYVPNNELASLIS